MGKIKEALYDIAETKAQLSKENMKPEHIEMELRDIIGPDMFELYLDNIEFVDEMVEDMMEDGQGEDESWTDPAGGVHGPGDDPAAMYESLHMPYIEDFE